MEDAFPVQIFLVLYPIDFQMSPGMGLPPLPLLYISLVIIPAVKMFHGV